MSYRNIGLVRSHYTKILLKKMKPFMRSKFKDIQYVNFRYLHENNWIIKIRFYVVTKIRFYTGTVIYDKIFDDFIDFNCETIGVQTEMEI